MYCVLCQSLKFRIICKDCLEHITAIHSKQKLRNGLKIFSSFALSEIKHLVYTKNNIIGSRILQKLGQYGVELFLQNHKEIEAIKADNIAVVCIRNRIIGAYSHSAILAHCFKQYGFKVFYNALIAQNDIRFATLTKAQRQSTSRDFHFCIEKKFIGIILVDDIITTGETLLEASDIITQRGHTPLFAWTLCDARF